MQIKHQTLLEIDRQSPVHFTKPTDHLTVASVFFKCVRDAISSKYAFKFDYAIHETDSVRQLTGYQLSDAFPCIVRECLDWGLVTNGGENKSFPGATTWYAYRGTTVSLFAFHREDMRLRSINFLFRRAFTYWLTVPPKYHDRALLGLRHGDVW